MRPTDSSLGPPRWLVVAVSLCGLAAVTCAMLPREWLLVRVPYVPGAIEQGAARWTLDEEVVRWDLTLPWYAIVHGSPQPRLVVVTDPTQAACQRLSREVLRDRWCATQLGLGFTCTRVEVDDPRGGSFAASTDSVMTRYRVTVLPTILFLDATGNETARITGYPGRDAVMREALARGQFHLHGYGGD